MKQALNSRRFKIFIGLAISLTAIWWVSQTVNWTEVWSKIRQISLWPLIPATLGLFLHYYLRAVRWSLLLPKDHNVSTRLRFDGIMVGNFVNFIFPLRAGEFVRGWFIAARSALSFSQIFLTVIIERFFDLSVVLFLFGIVTLLKPVPDSMAAASKESFSLIEKGAASLTVLAGGILCFLVLSAMAPSFIRLVSRPFFSLAERLGVPARLIALGHKLLDDILEGVKVLRSVTTTAQVILLSLAVWGTAALVNMMFFWCFGINPEPGLVLAVTVFISLAVAAPSAPGFIGVFQAGGIAGATLYGLSRDLGGAYSIVLHAYTYIFIILYGAVLMFNYRLSLKKLQEVAEEDGSEEAPPLELSA